ncbi:unnamed protein product, partial [marine sediment metagenome]
QLEKTKEVAYKKDKVKEIIYNKVEVISIIDDKIGGEDIPRTRPRIREILEPNKVIQIKWITAKARII